MKLFETISRGKHRLTRRTLALASLTGAAVITSVLAVAQVVPGAGLFEPLTGVKPPEPAELDQFIKDRATAIALGKALFWDQNLGSDSRTACASCHFHAGADNRVKNQLDPNLANVDPGIGSRFNRTRSGGAGGPNYTLRLGDFPTHQLADPNNRNSAIVFQTDDVVGSAGVFFAAFDPNNGRFSKFGGLLAGTPSDRPLQPGSTGTAPVGQLVNGIVTSLTAPISGVTPIQRDSCDLRMDDVFNVHATNTRRVTGRNAPTTINAVFNHRNFWDGRANNVFNGSSPFGPRDPDAGVWVTTPQGLSKVRVALENSSAASQAVGPVNSEFEMACAGRVFPNVGKRVLSAKPLSGQTVSAEDSVLAAHRNSVAGLLATPGLNKSYAEFIKLAFHERFWSSPNPVMIGGTAYSQMEANFALFFGLAIQMYESTLVSDQTPLDAYLAGDRNALTEQEKRGMVIFATKGKCLDCHNGPQLTNAGTPLINNLEFIERMGLANGVAALYDGGFYNLGVRPTGEDIGLGALDPWGKPLSFTRQYKQQLAGVRPADKIIVNTCSFEALPCRTPASNARDAVDGSFKTPGLRNVELTGPYFHNGSAATLEQVVEFYNRGGNARGSVASNTTGFRSNPSNLSPDIVPLGLTAAEQADLVAFMKRPLTDLRVSWERAPFDHPQLFIPNGHVGNEAVVVGNLNRQATDSFRELPAVGRNGRSPSMGPLKPFVDGLRP